MKISKKITTVAMLFLLSLLSMTALGQGLEEATDAVQEFQDWMYVILGIASVMYIMYNVGMAMSDKKTWGDVGMAIGLVAVAGGSITAATWAFGIWA